MHVPAAGWKFMCEKFQEEKRGGGERDQNLKRIYTDMRCVPQRGCKKTSINAPMDENDGGGCKKRKERGLIKFKINPKV